MEEQLLPAVQKAYDICRWLIPHVERFPRTHKFTLGDRLYATALDLTLALNEATYARAQDRPLHRADRLLDQLRILLRLSRDLRATTLRQYGYVTSMTEELGRMIGGWIKSRGAPGGVRPDPAAP